jgi:leucyl aminopeptidase (aminopeptidase T)
VDVTWSDVAQRAVQGLGVEAEELVLVRDLAGRPEVLSEVLLAVEQQGATPLPEILPPEYQRRLLQTAPVSYLAAWDQHRMGWVRQAHRVLVLEGAEPDTEGVLDVALDAWAAAGGRLNAVDEERRLPYLLVAVPTAERATALGLSLPELDAVLVPALAADTAQLRHEITRVQTAVERAGTLTIRSGGGCELRLALGDRPWLDDDGVITAEDRARGAQVVMNLPSGTVYTTVLEGETRGRLHLSGVGGDAGATLHFDDGSVTEVEGGAGVDGVRAMFDRHSGDARRVGHIGVGLNPYLRRPLDWSLVDIHAHGCLLVSFGENRYLGGENASSLNVDFALPGATLLVDDHVVVDAGVVVV